MDYERFHTLMTGQEVDQIQIEKVDRVAAHLLEAGRILCESIPPSAERTLALRSLQESATKVALAVFMAPKP